MEEKQVEETGQARYRRLQAEAKGLGIDTNKMNTEQLESAIDAAKNTEGPTGITLEEAKSIEARLQFEEEVRDKIRAERKIVTEAAELIAASELACIPINLPQNPTALDLAKARQILKIKKREEKPSPETLGIEASKRGYYVFNNLEQEDASHTVNLGGKYPIHLIPDQVHVLSEFHVKRWAKCAVRPVYERVSTGIEAGPSTEGRAAEVCQRTGSKRRFSFEYLGEAPIEANFGLVTDQKILEELHIEV